MTKIQKIEDSFKDKQLIKLAFTHRSWVNENPSPLGNNERLEFLGDAILEYIVSNFIYTKFPQKDEGFLTYLRSRIVDKINLAEVAKKLELADKILLSKGEENTGGRSNPAILADTVESVIGAIFMDQGISAATDFINEYLLQDVDDKLQKPLKDPKSRLQEAVQAEGKFAPKYKVLKQTGPDHDPTFEVAVVIDNNQTAVGKGSTKFEAEQAAAESALANFAEKK